MAEVALTTPYALKNATLTFDVDGYSDHATQVEFTPATERANVLTISGKNVADQSKATWTCTLGLVQDLSPQGLLRYLLDNDGEKMSCTFVPSDGGPSVSATLVIAPATIGGTAGPSPATATATMAVDGVPAFVDAA